MDKNFRCKTPEPISVSFKPGEDPPYTHEPRKVVVVIPDIPKKSFPTFFCKICGYEKNVKKICMTDSLGNQYCDVCY